MQVFYCKNCGQKVERSGGKPGIHCSRRCYSEYVKRTGVNSGANNANYKKGIYCTDSLCECGNIKDYRAIKCSICSNSGFAKAGAKERVRDYDLIEAEFKKSTSFVELASKIGMSRQTLKRIANKLGIDSDHFNVKMTEDAVIKTLFRLNHSDTRRNVKKQILKYNVIEYKCNKCGTGPVYNNQPLTIQLHHIDGDRRNNTLENLEFLCPNCHSQTHSYCGGNKIKYKDEHK